ncbi:MAG: hypothetical protein Q8N34_03445 [Gammaproteobacteria bacterium]|nr:hypothetical protein [Gammaproteobacteria bacterium]
MFNVYDNVRGKWQSPIRFKINPLHSAIAVEDLVKATMENVSMLRLFTDIDFQYAGLTSQTPQKIPDAEFVIGFLPAEQYVVTYGDSWAYANIWWTDRIYDANMVFNPAHVTNAQRFRSIQLHEWKHVLGFDHSDEEESILMDEPYHPWQYQGLLRRPDMIGLWVTYQPHAAHHPAPICVTNEYLIYIPYIQHPNTHKFYSVEMTYQGSSTGSMRFFVTKMVEVTDPVSPVQIHAFVNGSRLIMMEVFQFGLRANLQMEMIGDEGTLWELRDVEFLE